MNKSSVSEGCRRRFALPLPLLAGCASTDDVVGYKARSADRSIQVSLARERLPAGTVSGQGCRDDGLRWSRQSDGSVAALDFGKRSGHD